MQAMFQANYFHFSKVPVIKRKLEESLVNMERIRNFFKTVIDNHKKNLDPVNVGNFIDSFLIAQKEGKDLADDDQLIILLMDFFLAGSETASRTMEWAVCFMAMYPEV